MKEMRAEKQHVGTRPANTLDYLIRPTYKVQPCFKIKDVHWTEGYWKDNEKIAFLLIVGVLILDNTSHLHAQILNGSFTTGDLTHWNTLGSPVVVTTGPTPPTGTPQALVLSTSGFDSFDKCFGGGN